jgi:hypothetical protein
MGKMKDLSLKRFGRLVAIKYTGKNRHRKSMWLCKCDCGLEVTVPINYLNNGSTKSCGCLRRELSIARSRKENEYFIEGPLTRMLVGDYKGNFFDCLIDTDLLEKVRNHKWVVKFNNRSNYRYAHTVATISGKRKYIFLHRFVTNAPTGKVVDHKNHNTLDNRLNNLRVCTGSENMQNRKGHASNNKSGFRNVHWLTQHKRWKVSMNVNGTRYYFGMFTDLEEAKKVAKEQRERLMPYAT